MATNKKTDGHRYSGVDSTPWKVIDGSGKEPLKDQFKGYKDAASAARQYTEATGEHAAPVRA